MRTTRGTVLLGAVAVLTAGVTACSAAGGGAVPTASAPQGPVTDKARQALTASSTEVHSLVDAIVTSTNAGAKLPFAKCADGHGDVTVAGACAGFDEAASCRPEAGSWPQRWGYNVNLRVTTLDASAAGASVMDSLRTAGWKLTNHNGGSKVLDYTAAKDGLTLHLLVDQAPGVLNLEGYGRCVSSDGTLAPA